MEYIRTGRIADLFFAVTFISILTIFVLKEIFYRTYKDSISIQEISEVSITTGFRNTADSVLNLKLNRRTRSLTLPE
ncbi:hypothetical protein RM549_04445 [Salegentibacter sp. F188]|uniref:Uncharacterized protein n=1 Tax=Autumnicola patrickiae TaxID=3075591 RepID=A0ABU3DZ68_9FLAO|nr:hypothetical protein [Salegentibacter sp. F188]MDT0689021.1 hypothetical protein [Salegentibacter sp. F188]